MPRTPDLRIGIDVGGTNTDAVVLDRDDRVLAKAKASTTPDVATGIEAAVAAVVRDGGPAGGPSPVDPSRVTHAMLGTTQATNAILERRDLQRVAVVRVGGPATHAIPPLATWPDDLRHAISAGEVIVGGGGEFDGTELAPFDGDALARFLQGPGRGADAVAITSVFAPVSDAHEREAERIVRRELGDVPVSLSSEVGSVGLLERENATVLNAVLRRVARRIASTLEAALAAHGIDAVPYFAQNDGTLMALDYVLDHPVLTIGSGPANSMRGAAALCGVDDALVADIGGTSTDVGALAGGFPRQSAIPVEVCGVRTNFRMPDVLSIALGGGSRVRPDGVGPDSVGYRLEREACAFGGRTPTLTDAAVKIGRARVGEAPNGGWPRDVDWEGAIATADAMLADAVDRVKIARDEMPLVMVGGGSIVGPDRIPGVSEIVRPPHFEVANAIGAAIALVSGQVDRLFHLGAGGRVAAVEQARQLAADEAVRAGADPRTVDVADMEELTVAYLPGPVLRIRARAAGALGAL